MGPGPAPTGPAVRRPTSFFSRPLPIFFLQPAAGLLSSADRCTSFFSWLPQWCLLSSHLSASHCNVFFFLYLAATVASPFFIELPWLSSFFGKAVNTAVQCWTVALGTTVLDSLLWVGPVAVLDSGIGDHCSGQPVVSVSCCSAGQWHWGPLFWTACCACVLLQCWTVALGTTVLDSLLCVCPAAVLDSGIGDHCSGQPVVCPAAVLDSGIGDHCS